MKKVLGSSVVVHALPPVCLDPIDAPLEPADVLAKRFNKHGETELLVSWSGKSQMEDSWMLSREFVECFPSFQLEGKFGFDGRGIDRYHNTYYWKNKRVEERKESE